MEDEKINKESNKENNTVLKSTIDYLKYVPIVYPLLVFLGYINYDFYYRKFGIDIFNYLSINELLFSFISIAYPILFYIFIFSIWGSLNDIVSQKKIKEHGNTERQKIITKVDKSYHKDRFKVAKKNFKKGKILKGISNTFLSMLIFIGFILNNYILYLAMFYFGYRLFIAPLFNIFSNDKIMSLFIFKTPAVLLSSVLAWSVVFLLYIAIKYNNSEISLKNLRFIYASMLICITISTLSNYQNIKAYNVAYKNSEKEVCFVYDNQNIESNKDRKFLGKTAEYIFIRDFNSRTNHIYNLSEVSHLKITSVINQKAKEK